MTEVQTEVQKGLRKQSKDFYAAGFDVLVKRWDKCINVGGGYVKTEMFPLGFNTSFFYYYYYFE
jgi:hypothetical protein